MVLKGSLRQDTLDRIHKFLAGDTSIRIPDAVMAIYKANYANQQSTQVQDTSTLEENIEMEQVKPKQSVPTPADPIEDLVSNSESTLSDEKLLDLYEQGKINPNNNQRLGQLLERLAESSEPVEDTDGDNDNFDVFTEAAGISDTIPCPVDKGDERVDDVKSDMDGLDLPEEPPWDEDAPENELIKQGLEDTRKKQQEQEKAATKPVKKTTRKKVESVTDSAPISVINTVQTDTIKVVQDDTDIVTPANTETDCKYGDPCWTQMILSELVPGSECIIVKDKQGEYIRPRCAGLKRLMEKYIGAILNAECDILAQPTRDNTGVWAVRATVTVQVLNRKHVAGMGQELKWSDVGQIFSHGSGNDITTLNPITSAYTMALSRCFKNLLGLSGIYSSEEMASKGQPVIPHDPDRAPLPNTDRSCTDKQVTMIQNLCDKYQKHALTFAQNVLQDMSLSELTEMTFGEAQKVLTEVNKLQYTNNQ